MATSAVYLMIKKAKTASPIETLAVIALFFLIVGTLKKNFLWIEVGVTFLLIGLFWKSLAFQITKFWLKIGEALGAINSRIILAATFFLFLMPLAFFYRLFRGDTLRLKRVEPEVKTFWTTREHSYEAKDFEHVW